ncbi:hypothetical protein [Novacetimonas hansenii]|uniref:hypothetical protein n=1 Tax=Novacetimonas hansenii TaxID=436 RepID=UPI000A47F13D|nr:hypothetical protein [Novacetimonas hansenii]
MDRQVILITGALSGFGAMTARRLAAAGQCVYAGVRDIAGKGAAAVKDAASFALEYS